MVGESELTKLVGDVTSDVSVDGTGELFVVLVLVDDKSGRTVNGTPAIAALHVRLPIHLE